MRNHFDLEAIKARLPIASVLELHGIPATRERARCPLAGVCDNKIGTSFAVYDDGRRWTCHRCHAHGDVFNLLAILEGLTVGEAIRRAAALAGVAPGTTPPLPRGPRPESAERRARRLLGKQFRVVAAQRDLFRGIARNPALPIEGRADALAGVVLCNRKLDLLMNELAEVRS